MVNLTAYMTQLQGWIQELSKGSLKGKELGIEAGVGIRTRTCESDKFQAPKTRSCDYRRPEALNSRL